MTRDKQFVLFHDNALDCRTDGFLRPTETAGHGASGKQREVPGRDQDW
jgi:hypothetical protein